MACYLAPQQVVEKEICACGWRLAAVRLGCGGWFVFVRGGVEGRRKTENVREQEKKMSMQFLL